jgi:hypothetical protein
MYEFDEDYGYGATDPYEYLDDYDQQVEEYSKRPISDDKACDRPDLVHHPKCAYQGRDIEDCNCKALYERDYQVEKEEELEDLHQEYWQ